MMLKLSFAVDLPSAVPRIFMERTDGSFTPYIT